MSVTRKDVEKIAALAELAVDDQAAAELERQLTRIVDYFAQLGEVTDDAAAGDARAARLRRDEIGPDSLTRAPKDIAPAFHGGLFTVPRLGELDRGDDVP
ncbi:MAG TPA: Asp-tRNA(Asn)/Glu-tRNA(Gln) amidotransferase subunit GatC [Gemmatimonadales bacterium]|nr:Asp-tRNA(Asn)/Glu-tRNA(Gln) amidotransferase subunit GatC [Gemmatimonadales bacterium]